MSGWRDRSEPAPRAPRSVAAVVRAVRSSLRATHAVESALLGVAAGLFARCALLLSDAPAGLHARLVVLLCAALAALTWWLEHEVELAPIARVLDRRLRHHGALVTAFELEQGRGAAGLSSAGLSSASPSSADLNPLNPSLNPLSLNPMEQLVGLRVLARLRTREAVRAVFPPLLVPLGAPTVAALCLVLLGDARRDEAPPAVDFVALAEGLGRALAVGALDSEAAGLEGADPDGELSRAQVQRLNEVLLARGSLPFASEDWTRDPEAVRARVEELDRKVAALAGEVAPGSELHGRLEESRAWLDALRTGLDPASPAAGEAAAEVAPSQGAPGSLSGSATEPAPDGTISGSPSAPGVRPMPTDPSALPNPQPSSPESVAPAGDRGLGLAAGNWWPGEYDGVVERWIELSRAAEAGGR